MEDLFRDIVGQPIAKSKLNFAYRTYQKTGIFSPIFLCGPSGDGKTALAIAIAKNLRCPSEPKRIKNFLEINSATIKSVDQFCEEFVEKKIEGKEVTVFFDEASELKNVLAKTLLSVVAPNKSNSKTLTVGGSTYTFDLRKITWIFATSEPNQVFKPLIDRLDRIDLQEYNTDELLEIVKLNVAPYKIDKAALEAIPDALRGNGRSSQKIGGKIKLYLEQQGRKQFTRADWEHLRKELYLLPLDLTPLEVRLLQTLHEKGPLSLTALASTLKMSRASLQHDVELYLLAKGLISIATPKGRFITNDGQNILKRVQTLYGEHFAPKEAVEISS